MPSGVFKAYSVTAKQCLWLRAIKNPVKRWSCLQLMEHMMQWYNMYIETAMWYGKLTGHTTIPPCYIKTGYWSSVRCVYVFLSLNQINEKKQQLIYCIKMWCIIDNNPKVQSTDEADCVYCTRVTNTKANFIKFVMFTFVWEQNLQM